MLKEIDYYVIAYHSVDYQLFINLFTVTPYVLLNISMTINDPTLLVDSN